MIAKLVSLILLIICAGATAFAKPPTPDPTYGLPLPARKSAEAGPKADWIWAAKSGNAQTVYLRREFTLGALPTVARMAVTADDSFTLTINGKQAAATPVDPTATPAAAAKAAASAWKNTQFVDVRPYLVAGRNVVALRAANGAGSAGAVCEMEGDGQPILRTDGTWRALDSPTPPEGWDTAGFNDSGWPAATVVAPLGGGPWGYGLLGGWLGDALLAPYMAHLPLRPVTVQTLPGGPTAPTALLLDFGKEVSGRIQLCGTPGTAVTVNTGESRAECLRLYAPKEHSGPYDLILTGNIPASTPNSGFRYARLVFPQKNPGAMTRAVCDFQYYPVTYKGAFDCSDPLLTRIWYTGIYTSHLCMQDDIMDAPKRDRTRWIGDLQISGEVINNAFLDRFLMEQTMTRLRAAAQGGRPPAALPKGEVNGVTGYSGAWFWTLADFYRHTGDIGYIKSQRALILSQLAYTQTDFDAHGLFTNPHGSWDFCDWAIGMRGARAPSSPETPDALQTTDMYLIAGVREAVFLLRALHDDANAAKYTAWADTHAAAARAAFFQYGCYGRSLQENAMAIDSGVATPAQAQSIYNVVLKAGRPAWNVPLATGKPVIAPMTPYYGAFVLQAYALSGHPQAGINLMRRYWGDMLRRGATTWWERFDPSYPDDMDTILTSVGDPSLCHGWSAGPTNYLTETVLGIRPTSGGFATATIAPHLETLAWASGTVPTPRGPLTVRIEKKKGMGNALTVTLPPGTVAQVLLPGTPPKTLSGPGTFQVRQPGIVKAGSDLPPP